MTDLLNVVYLFLNYVRIFRKLIDKLASADGITGGALFCGIGVQKILASWLVIGCGLNCNKKRRNINVFD